MLITDQVATAPCTDHWTQSVPPAVAGGCAAFTPVLRRSVAAQLRTHPLPQVVLTVFNRNSRLSRQSYSSSKLAKSVNTCCSSSVINDNSDKGCRGWETMPASNLSRC